MGNPCIQEGHWSSPLSSLLHRTISSCKRMCRFHQLRRQKPRKAHFHLWFYNVQIFKNLQKYCLEEVLSFATAAKVLIQKNSLKLRLGFFEILFTWLFKSHGGTRIFKVRQRFLRPSLSVWNCTIGVRFQSKHVKIYVNQNSDYEALMWHLIYTYYIQIQETGNWQ